MALRAHNEATGHTIDQPLTSERQATRTELADKVYGMDGARVKNRRADIVIGPPAAGKSTTFAEPLAREHGSLVIDSDNIKPDLPEYEGGKRASVVHRESSLIAKAVLQRAVENGDNIVLPRIGKSIEKLSSMIDLLKQNGYDVHLMLNHLDADKAAQRVVERFNETGRFVDPAYALYEVGNKPLQAGKALKNDARLSSFRAFDADVARGEYPKPLSL